MEYGANNHLIIAPGPYFIVRSRIMKKEKQRYVGIDLGKREYTMAIIGKNGKMSIHKGRQAFKGVRLYTSFLKRVTRSP
jgi:hypothetical protein